jgi:hypothetical protein
MNLIYMIGTSPKLNVSNNGNGTFEVVAVVGFL